MTTVGVMLYGRDGCRRTMLSHSRGCCVVAAGVVTPCCIVVVMGVTPRGVAVTVAALVVSWSRLLHHMWCCGR